MVGIDSKEERDSLGIFFCTWLLLCIYYMMTHVNNRTMKNQSNLHFRVPLSSSSFVGTSSVASSFCSNLTRANVSEYRCRTISTYIGSYNDINIPTPRYTFYKIVLISMLGIGLNMTSEGHNF